MSDYNTWKDNNDDEIIKESSNNENSNKENLKIIGFSGKIGSGKNYIGEEIVGEELNRLGYNVHSLGFADQIKFEMASRSKKIDKFTDNSILENKLNNIKMENILDFVYKLMNKSTIRDILKFMVFLFKKLINLILFLFPFILKENYLLWKKREEKLKLSNEYISLSPKILKKNKENYELVFHKKPQYIRMELQEHADERKYDEYVWINSLHLRIMNILEKSYNPEKEIFIITDVRFVNEIYFIKELGGIIVRILPEKNKIEVNDDNEKLNKNFNENNKKINSHNSEVELDNFEGYDLKIINTYDENVNVSSIYDKIFNKENFIAEHSK